MATGGYIVRWAARCFPYIGRPPLLRKKDSMRITKLGHSCLHVVDGDADILLDPGTFSTGFEQLTGLTAVLITHQPPDPLDLDRLPAVLAANPQATVYA